VFQKHALYQGTISIVPKSAGITKGFNPCAMTNELARPFLKHALLKNTVRTRSWLDGRRVFHGSSHQLCLFAANSFGFWERSGVQKNALERQRPQIISLGPLPIGYPSYWTPPEKLKIP
jgi:hypothetical protein